MQEKGGSIIIMIMGGFIFVSFFIFLFYIARDEGAFSNWKVRQFLVIYMFFGLFFFISGLISYLKMKWDIQTENITYYRSDQDIINSYKWKARFLLFNTIAMSICFLFVSILPVNWIVLKIKGNEPNFDIFNLNYLFWFVLSLLLLLLSYSFRKEYLRKIIIMRLELGDIFSCLSVWAKEVKDRDGNICIFCGATENLESHHLAPQRKYKSLKYLLINGVTLCRRCHIAAELTFRRLSIVCDIKSKIK